jgi:hypothetical protein
MAGEVGEEFLDGFEGTAACFLWKKEYPFVFLGEFEGGERNE